MNPQPNPNPPEPAVEAATPPIATARRRGLPGARLLHPTALLATTARFAAVVPKLPPYKGD